MSAPPKKKPRHAVGAAPGAISKVSKFHGSSVPTSAPAAAEPFAKSASEFLIAYAAQRRGQSFSAEDVTLAALDAGLAPLDLRSWGHIFIQVARDGHIRRSRAVFPRAMGNQTLVPGWEAV